MHVTAAHEAVLYRATEVCHVGNIGRPRKADYVRTTEHGRRHQAPDFRVTRGSHRCAE